MEYTKGVWKVSSRGRDIYVNDKTSRHEKYIAYLTHLLLDPNEVKANAHLIAAAPDMYEALKELLEVARPLSPGLSTVTEHDLAIATKALSKAEGK